VRLAFWWALEGGMSERQMVRGLEGSVCGECEVGILVFGGLEGGVEGLFFHLAVRLGGRRGGV
jgi:hypothetical protein